MSRAVLSLVLAFASAAAPAVEISNRYRSPRNPERKVRQSTELIVLHTTEAPARSSLNKVSERGECHYCVTEEGSVYRIVDRDREAFHAGRSMWNGREDVDKFSVGIECVGYHNKAMSRVQLAAIRDLVKELKTMYRIPDERVVCHSHVAYGTPNKWQKRRHRGRKRCGMLFAMPSVRRVLGLTKRPAYDPDTRSCRLTVGDEYLKNVLYGSVDTMIAAYGRTAAPVAKKPEPPPIKVFAKPAPKSPPRPAPRKESVAVAPSAPKASGKSVAKPSPKPAADEKAPKSVAQLMLAGYAELGVVTAENTASRIAGNRWNANDTYYVLNGKVTPGSAIDAAHIEKGMSIWRKK